jgi:micrococcal nuclease
LIIVAILAIAVGWLVLDERFGRPGPSEPDRMVTSAPAFYTDDLLARFRFCDGPIRSNCVVDGDTFWFRGEKIRIADIDAPEISEPECPAEKQVGETARDRLLALLNEGRFSLTAGWRDEDRYGRKLRTVWRSGKSLGMALVEEGMARRWNGPAFGWCAG